VGTSGEGVGGTSEEGDLRGGELKGERHSTRGKLKQKSWLNKSGVLPGECQG
jgi:hypothetical protein